MCTVGDAGGCAHQGGRKPNFSRGVARARVRVAGEGSSGFGHRGQLQAAHRKQMAFSVCVMDNHQTQWHLGRVSCRTE